MPSAIQALTGEAALASDRGRASLIDWLNISEAGTDEDVAKELWRRGAAIRSDIILRRIVSPAVEPTRTQLVIWGERYIKSL